LERVDIELLYAVAKADKAGKPVTTWDLAKLWSPKITTRNKLDGVFRYHLNLLVKKRLLIPITDDNGTTKRYVLNPKRFACVNGALFILGDPVFSVYACPYVTKCPTCNIQVDVRFRDKTGHFCKSQGSGHKPIYIVHGCKLLKTAPDSVKEQFYKILEETNGCPATSVPEPIPIPIPS